MSKIKYFLFILMFSAFSISCKPVHVEKPEESAEPSQDVPGEIQAKSAYEIINENCLSCHNNGVAAPSWGNIDSETAFNTFASASISRIKAGSPDESNLILRMKYGPGDQSMPPIKTSMSREDYLVVYNWIKNMQVPEEPAPEPTPNPTTPMPAPVVETAFSVVSTHCLNCHNGAYAPSWGSLTSEAAFTAFALSGSSRIKPGKPNESTIILRMKHGPGDRSMPPGMSSLTVTQYELVYNWIAQLPDTPIVPVEPEPPVPHSETNSMAISSSEKLRLGDRKFIASVFRNIFGSSAETLIRNNILAKTAKFGGACDYSNSYAHSYPTKIRCNEAGINLVSDLVDTDMVNIEAPRIPNSTVDREGYRVYLCKQALLGDNLALENIIRKVKKSTDLTFLNSTPQMTDDDITNLYKLFYPGRAPKTNILSSLRAISVAAQSGLAPVSTHGLKYESWRYVSLTLCKAPDWQFE